MENALHKYLFIIIIIIIIIIIPCQPFDVIVKLRLFRGFSTKDAFDFRLHRSELFINGGLVSLFRSFKYDSISRLFHYEEKWKVNGLNM